MTTRMLRLWPCLAALLTLGLPVLTRAATLNVPSAAYPTIQAGVDASHDGDTVMVADGTYTGDGNRDIDFHGKSLTVTSQNGPAKTIIDCGGYKSTDGSGNHRGFYIDNGEKNATISGFTVKNGYEVSISTIPGSGRGGGVYNFSNSNSKITLTNCTITGNTAHDGGGIYNESSGGGTTTLTNCTITGNMVYYGGGILNYNGGTTTLTNCALTGNSATYGGGIYNYNYGVITLTNCTLTGNTAGHAVYGRGTATASFSDIQGGYPGTSNIDADPQFVNAAAGDLHLKPGSPCLGKGTPNGAPATDLDGNPRPNPPSRGAYDSPNAPCTR